MELKAQFGSIPHSTGNLQVSLCGLKVHVQIVSAQIVSAQFVSAQIVSAQIVSGTNCIGNKLYREHNVSGTNCIGNKLYREQTVSGTICIGHKLYRLPFIFLPFQQAAENQPPPPPLFPIKLWNMFESILADKEITNNHVEGMKDL